MNGAYSAFALFVALFSLAPTWSLKQSSGQRPDSTPPVTLGGSVSLVDRDVAYGGVDRGAGDPNQREPLGRVRQFGEVFGWHDGTIRLAGMLDTAGGCARPTGIRARLVGETVHVLIETARMLCPAIYTPEQVYARVTGLAPGRYHLKIQTGRTVELPVPSEGVEVPATPAPR